MTIWAAISWYSAGPIITLKGRLTTSDYVDILGNQVCPMVQMLFPNKEAIFQGSTTRSVQSWFDEHEDALHYLPWPAQSLELNTIKPPVTFRG